MEEIKILLGDAAPNYSDALISLCYKQSLAEVEDYCKRELDATLEYAAQQITVIKLNRMGSEGLASQGYSGVSESYLNDYPANIIKILNSKRRLRVI